MSKLTVKDLLNAKGNRQLTEVLVSSAEEAAACESAGIDILVLGAATPKAASELRQAAPNSFCIIGIPYGQCASEAEAIQAGFNCLSNGADAVYAAMSPAFIAAMSREFIPVVGHVGLVPATNTWTGGYKAVGKTANDAMKVFEHTLALQDAGAIAVEMEDVPHEIAAEITNRVSLIVISMGSGSACDAQYLFATDILGSNRGHIPRHAKVYRNFAAEFDRLQRIRIDAFKEYCADVRDGSFPDNARIVSCAPAELDRFRNKLDSIQ